MGDRTDCLSDADVVVVGAGNAALCAALAARQAGASVQVLERAPEDEAGGNSRFTAGAFRCVYNGIDDLRRLMPDYDVAILEKWSGVRGIAEASLLKTKRLHMNEKWLWSNFVQSLKKQGFSLYAYTVNSQERADELKKWGVDGIITDYPNRIKR